MGHKIEHDPFGAGENQIEQRQKRLASPQTWYAISTE